MVKTNGFTLIETLTVVAILGILSLFILVSVFGIREKAKDTKRKIEVSQAGRYLTNGCYVPDAGAGEYDLIPLTQEIFSKNPQYKEFLQTVPKDPKTGDETESKYMYVVAPGGTKCALYANLENKKEKITLSITEPTPGGGTGVFKGSIGWNGTDVYFQYSN